MIENIDLSLVSWSRAQFALTAIYHWFFVPLTLGLSFIIAMMETIYYRTGSEEWKRITKFWMKLFGINFAIGVATGIILEFEFGTNWSAYSWFVGDIFGTPLAIEGILAFFLESTFIAVMFFGWNRVSNRFHLVSTWLVAIGASLSALWILVANAWMQNPVGMTFNPETARNEMTNFLEVLFNPVAADKFLHTITSGFVLASVFVAGISAWFLLKKRETYLATRSILIAGIFGFLSSVLLAITGDMSARSVAKYQPVKFASFEALNEGKSRAPLVAAGILKKGEKGVGRKNMPEFIFAIEIPNLLSFMTGGSKDAYVPGIYDHIEGNPRAGILSFAEKKERGQKAREALLEYKRAKEAGDEKKASDIAALFTSKDFRENYFRYFGYAYIDNPEDIIPDIRVSFYTFHLMVLLGFFFILLFALMLWFLFRNSIRKHKWLLWIMLLSIPLPYLASELGWVLAEMGRQPWIIQDLMPVSVGVTNLKSGNVQTTFWLFAVLFTALLIAEISIMVKQVKNGPEKTEEKL
ncbi:MAG: cytochrome ubiquinol oxidase subunit I [Bacteroidales bacterium]